MISRLALLHVDRARNLPECVSSSVPRYRRNGRDSASAHYADRSIASMLHAPAQLSVSYGQYAPSANNARLTGAVRCKQAALTSPMLSDRHYSRLITFL